MPSDELSKLAAWLWLQFRSMHKHAIPKEDGFEDWWAQHSAAFDLDEPKARAIYQAGQEVMAQAVRDVHDYLKNSDMEATARIEKMVEGSKWRCGELPNEQAHFVYEGNRLIAQCFLPGDAKQIVEALARWDIKTGIRILAPEYECPMCGAPTKKEVA
jgi:hypothetical protein